MSSASIRFSSRTSTPPAAAGCASRKSARLQDGLRLADQPLQRPVAAALDARRDARQRGDRAEPAAASGKREGRDVVLDPGLVADERRRPEQVDRAVWPDQAAAGERRARREEQAPARRRGSPSWARGVAVASHDLRRGRPPGRRWPLRLQSSAIGSLGRDRARPGMPDRTDLARPLFARSQRAYPAGRTVRHPGPSLQEPTRGRVMYVRS